MPSFHFEYKGNTREPAEVQIFKKLEPRCGQLNPRNYVAVLDLQLKFIAEDLKM